MKTPLVSIITVVYNAVDVIETTITSITSQTTDDYEYLIIDGNSTDGTQGIVEKYLDKIDIWISEPDKGIPDALNKGVRFAKGKYILFILAGDKLLELPYRQLADKNADLVCFPVMVTGNVIHYPEVNKWLKIMNTIPHQGAFFKKTEHLIHDIKYRFFCDLDLCQIYYKKKLSIRIYDSPVVAFHGLDGATSNKKNFREVFAIVEENFGYAYKALSFLYWKYDGLLRRLKLR